MARINATPHKQDEPKVEPSGENLFIYTRIKLPQELHTKLLIHKGEASKAAGQTVSMHDILLGMVEREVAHIKLPSFRNKKVS